MTSLILLFVGAYLFGGIPIGVIVTRAKGIDIFKVGSGNIGATNVKRALGTKWGMAVFVLDVVKGVVPTVVARFVVHESYGGLDQEVWWFLVGLTAVMGHCLSPYLRFRGGKGIATALGASVAAAPLVALSAFGVFLAIFIATAYVSLASIVAAPTTVLFGLLIPGESRQMLPVYFLMSGFLIYRHRANIKRLREGTESKTHLFKKKNDPDAKNV